MKQFVNKILILKLLVLLVLFVVSVGNRVLFDYIKPFKLACNVNEVILGDSHAKFAFNDSILVHSKNLSNSADSYFYSYLKLKKIISENNCIDTIFLSFSEHNLNKDIESRWLLNDTQLKQRLRLYFPLLDGEDLLFLLKHKTIDLFIGTFNQLYFPMYVSRGTKKFGGYEDLYLDNLAQELENFKKQESNNDTSFIKADIEIEYLRKIAKLCRIKKISLILVNTPLHKVLHNHQDNLYQTYNKYFLDIPFFDYSTMSLDDSCFTDLVHLNKKGAIIFSNAFRNKDDLEFKDNRYVYMIK